MAYLEGKGGSEKGSWPGKYGGKGGKAGKGGKYGAYYSIRQDDHPDMAI